MLKTAFRDALRKFDPRALSKNFVILVTALGALISTIVLVRDVAAGQPFSFTLQITLWLWFTVLFANFAEAWAEGRGKAQADALKKMRVYVNARLLTDKGTEEIVSVSELRKGQKVLCEAGDVIPLDGEVIEGIASVDESAITGESAPVRDGRHPRDQRRHCHPHHGGAGQYLPGPHDCHGGRRQPSKDAQ